jgi:cell division septum initiation protein DivIVA
MKLGQNQMKKKFDDIDGKIDFVIELCNTLQQENRELMLKIEDLENELDRKSETEEKFSKNEAIVQSKIERLLTKLDSFAGSSSTIEHLSNQ